MPFKYYQYDFYRAYWVSGTTHYYSLLLATTGFAFLEGSKILTVGPVLFGLIGDMPSVLVEIM